MTTTTPTRDDLMCRAAAARARVVLPGGRAATLTRWRGRRPDGRPRGAYARVTLDGTGAALTVRCCQVRLLCARDGYDPEGCTAPVPDELAQWRLCEQCAADLMAIGWQAAQ